MSPYDNISPISTDIEKLNIVFQILLKESTPNYISYPKLKIPYAKQGAFDAKLKETGLIKAIQEENASSPRFALNDQGHLMMEKFGSYSQYKKHKDEATESQEQQAKNIESLKLESLVLDVNKLRREVADYGDSQKRIKRNEVYVVISILMSAIAILISILGKKFG